MEIMQVPDSALQRKLFEKTLRADEHIACENATVVTNADGVVTAWFRNEQPLCFISTGE